MQRRNGAHIYNILLQYQFARTKRRKQIFPSMDNKREIDVCKLKSEIREDNDSCIS